MKLYFENGDRRGQFWKLAPPGICIGREEDNDIQLLLPGISRYHAKVEYTGTQWRIMDLGSTNGTKINGKIIDAPVILEDGMQISLGEQIIRFVKQDQEKPAPVKETEKIVPEQKQEKTAPVSPPGPPPSPQTKKQTNTAPANDPGTKTPFQKISGDIFRKKDSSGTGKDPDPTAQSGSNSKKRIHNLLFLLLVMVLGCGVIFVFTVLNTSPRQNKTSTGVRMIRNPFILEYEKKLKSADNIFRFYVRIEENSAIFKLNDLRHRRHFTKGIGQVDQAVLDTLIRDIRQTDFMKITSDPPGKPRDGVDDYRALTIGFGSSFNSVVNHNSYPKRSFEEIEGALENFAAEFGLRTISLSEKQMVDEAEQSFAKAEELFRNYQARPENLRNAILRYQITVDFLEQFEPKPQNYITAKRRLAEAGKLLNTLKKDAEFQINVFYRRRQFREAVEECNKLLLILDPEEKNYQKIRDLKIVLEKRIDPKKNGRSGRR